MPGKVASPGPPVCAATPTLAAWRSTCTPTRRRATAPRRRPSSCSGGEAGLTHVALTDHDTTLGWAEAADAARAARHPAGAAASRSRAARRHRASTCWPTCPTPTTPTLVAELARARDSRDTRLDRMVELMAADGIPVTVESVRAEVERRVRPRVGRTSPTRSSTAGVVAHRDEAFARWLGNDSPYYVSHYAPDPVRAVELVRAAGGVPVIAHPWSGTRGRVVERRAGRGDGRRPGSPGSRSHHRDHTPGGRAPPQRAGRARWACSPPGRATTTARAS